jgi:hypothetical protein
MIDIQTEKDIIENEMRKDHEPKSPGPTSKFQFSGHDSPMRIFMTEKECDLFINTEPIREIIYHFFVIN